MIKIAIVEDEDAEEVILQAALRRYGEENSEEFDITRFTNALDFLENCRNNFDIVFMDIKMPGMNGMDAARDFRQFDNETILIFITTIAQFAVKGYAVDALDYIIKPVQYQRLSFVLKKAIRLIRANEEFFVTVAQKSGILRLSTKSLYYIEVEGHTLSYHTDKEIITGYGSLSELEKKLEPVSFLRCNSCYLVNPKFILSVQGLSIIMRNNDELKISQSKRKKFIGDLTKWLGKGNFS